ncbi:hypothetical protein niasHT_026446 [Heterodera trifolii]|uniref:BRICHOS domain-containing protein n=1 Tax=Heterodera trifolii TaxID=157864 RepID=A0ABD2KJQ1_9BILA
MDPLRHSPAHEKRVEQIEIIERTVEESRRPLTSEELVNFQPQSSLRTSSERILFPDPEKRFQLTSERDAGRDSSLLYSPSGQNSFIVREAPLQQSTPERNQQTHKNGLTISRHGYDADEVLTLERGERVTETHGQKGHPTKDRSVGETSGAIVRRTPPRREDTATKSILKTVPPMASPEGTVGENSWRKSPASMEGSVQRKDSYRRMQVKQEEETDVQQPTSFYGQSPNATILSKSSKHLWPEMFSAEHRGKNSLARIKGSIAEMSRQMSDGEWTPRLVALLCLVLLLLLLVLLLLWLLVSSLLLHRSTFAFWLYPPPCEECQRRNGGGTSDTQQPSRLFVHLNSPAQAHFELIGNPPFKSNSFTAVDFDTGFVAIADHALTDEQGTHTTCFVMELDRSAMPDMDVLQDALSNTYSEVHSQFGWQEYWQYVAEEVDSSFVLQKFRDRIDDCQRATKWYRLKHTVYTRDSACYNCYDFCLPDFAVLRRQKYEDKMSLGIRRLNCFRLFVPEWAKYEVQTDPSGGHWHYPKHTAKKTQRDAEGNWEKGGGGGQKQRRKRRRSGAAEEAEEGTD